MATEFKLPELGEGVESADIARIHVAEGDQIEAEQNLMELETEKAVADLPCPHAGKITKIHVSEGDTIHVGQTLVTIEQVEADTEEKQEDPTEQQSEKKTKSEDKKKKKKKSKRSDPTSKRNNDKKDKDNKDNDTAKESEYEEEEATDAGDTSHAHQANGQGSKSDAAKKSERAVTDEADPEDQAGEQDAADSQDSVQAADQQRDKKNGRQVAQEAPPDGSPSETHREEHTLPPPAGPATRRLARKLGIDLEQLRPPEGGRIRQEDVVRVYVESGKAAMASSQSLPDFSRFGPTTREPLSKIAQTAARRLMDSWRSIPQVTQHGLADITTLEAARRQHADRTGAASPKITMTAIAVKSVVGLLRDFPKFNASLDYETQELILKSYYHIGVAVDTDHGLLVPVVRDVDRKSIEDIAAELQRLAQDARQRKLQKKDLEGATFTISNQGSIGGGEFTPLVSFPEVAILGMARARSELRMVDGQPAERLCLPLSLSYDHRVINGADAARFMERLTGVLADEFTLLVTT